jgi:hypothetical protein
MTMIIRSILILLALSVVPAVSFAQQFQSLHDYDSTGDFGWNVFVQSGGEYFVTTGAHNYTTGKAQQGWMNITQNGSIISSKKLLSSNIVNFYQGQATGEVKKLQDGGYLVPISFTTPDRSSIGLMKLNAQFDTVFTRFYTDTSIYREDAAACAVLPNGNFLVGGYSAPNLAPRDSAIIICTDSGGNVVWKRKYKKLPGQNEWPCIVSLEAIDNNRILVGAMSTHLVYTQIDQYGHNTPWFMILDTLGNVLKDTTYINTVHSGGGKIFRDLWGGYFHYGSFDSLYTQDPTDAINFPEYIAHLNDDLEIEWIRNLGTWDGHKYIWHAEQLPDGSFQLCGSNGTDQTWLTGWAARYDHNGWAIWDNDYLCDPDWSSYLVDFDVRQDGSLIMIGAARNDTVEQWRGQELWLVSVDANGCLVPGCDPTIVKPLNTNKEADLGVYPNPTTGEFIVDCAGGTLSLVSIDGRVLKEYEAAEGKTELQLPQSLTPGVYMLKYTPEKGTGSTLTRLVYQP